MANFYVASDKYAAVSMWTALTSYPVGSIVRQRAAVTYGNERCFRATGGTTGISGAAEPTWSIVINGSTSETTVTWTECSGQAVYNGDGGGSAWAAPYCTYMTCTNLSAPAAGDTVYLSSAHTETWTTAQSLAQVTSEIAPMRAISVTANAAPPTTLTPGATIATTGASSITFFSNPAGAKYFYGINFSAGSGASLASIIFWSGATSANPTWENCTFTLNNTNSSSVFNMMGNANHHIRLNNCAFIYGHVNQLMTMTSGDLNMTGGSIALTGAIPVQPISIPNTGYVFVNIADCNLSGLTAAGTTALFNCAMGYAAYYTLQNCKLANAIPITVGAYQKRGEVTIDMDNCDSASTDYRLYRGRYEGTVQSETTTVRSGGASDGSTTISWKATPTSSTFATPLMLPYIMTWYPGSGASVTASIQIASTVTLYTDDIWIELEYQSSATSPISTLASGRSLIGGRVAYTTSAASWGGSQSVFQVLSIAFTPMVKGVVRARVCIAKAGTVIYVDPMMTMT